MEAEISGNYTQLTQTLALMLGASWASGINLYAAMLMLGLSGATGSFDLPPGLEVLENPLVIGAAGVMYAVEFFADKIPGVDSLWDTLHTFVRIPAGALMAAGTVGDMGLPMEIAAGILGGGLATATHATKAGARAMINTSPEPFTNWGASIGEDVAVLGGMWAALHHPFIFLALLILFIMLMAWLLPKLWRGIKAAFRWLARLFGSDTDPLPAAAGAASAPPPPAVTASAPDRYEQLHKLQALRDSGALTDAEFQAEKKKLLS